MMEGKAGNEEEIRGEENTKLSEVMNSIEKTLGLLHQLRVTLSSFDVLPLLHRINALVLELDIMMKLSDNTNIEVPLDVLSLIDDGNNPDAFTRDLLNSCVSKNQFTGGKTDSFKTLRKHLLEELEHSFPTQVDTYREIRASFG